MEKLKQKILPILHKYGITRAGLFGSTARNENTGFSDVDILVKIDKKISLIDFVTIKLELEKTLNKKVDLVEYESIKPLLKDHILSEEIRIL